MNQNRLLQWNFETPDAKNFLAPLQAGIDAGYRDRQQSVENERQNMLLQFRRQQLDMEQGRYGMERDKFGRDMSQRDQMDPIAVQQAKLGLDQTQAGIAQTRAGTNLANVQAGNVGQTDIVRNMRAAGIDPGSAEGQQLIRNSIKGGSPVDIAIANSIAGAISQPRQAGPPQQPRFQPQSFEGEDPNLIRTQAGPGQQPQPPMVDTPLGKMPQNNARSLAFGLAYQGKGEAGKMMMPDQGMGKTGEGELDKEIIAKATDIADLNNIRQSFKPEFLGLEGTLKSTGLRWADWLKSGSLKPEQQQYVREYATMATATTERLNNRIKSLSGAAVSAAEEKRMFGANPTMNDGPTEFQAKLDTQIQMQRMAIARFNWLRTQYKGTPEDIARLAQSGKIESMETLDGMKQRINSELDSRAQQLRQANPGMDERQLREALTLHRKQVFGI